MSFYQFNGLWHEEPTLSEVDGCRHGQVTAVPATSIAIQIPDVPWEEACWQNPWIEECEKNQP